MSDLNLEIIESATDEQLEAVKVVLRQYNHEKNPEFFAKWQRPDQFDIKLHVFARNPSSQIIGGVIAVTQFSWLKIDILAVHSDYRGRGIGTKLIRSAEEEALRRGCKYAFLDTADYQAPKFYEKIGYEMAGQLPDWDSHGHTKYFFIRRLT